MKKIVIVLVILSAIAAAVAIGYFKQSNQKEHDNAEYVNNNNEIQVVTEQSNDVGKKLYVSKSYKVSFSYPKEWNLKPNEEANSNVIVSYSAKGEYLNIHALEGNDMDIETVALNEVYQKGQPYGGSPHIYSGKINGLEGMFVVPSSDQKGDFKNQSICILKFLKPVTVNGKEYSYVRVHSTKDNVPIIAKSIRQIN